MKDYLDIESVPVEEPCAQLGENIYYERSMAECRAYINQLKRKFGTPPGNAYIKIASNPYDQGTYYSLQLIFDDDNEEESEWAYEIEGSLPEIWDEEARKELIKAGYFDMGS